MINRDWKGSYSSDDMDKARGMILIGGEEDIQYAGNDCKYLVFSKKPTKLTAQAIFELDKKLMEEGVKGFDSDGQGIIKEL